MIQRSIKHMLCIILLSSFSRAVGMEAEHQSPELEKLLGRSSANQSPLHGMAIPQHRGSLPDRRHITLFALRDFHSHHSTPEGTPREAGKMAIIASLQESRTETPKTNGSTPLGTPLRNLKDTISVIAIKKAVDLEDGWIEKKQRAFKTALFSSANVEATTDGMEAGTIVYHVHRNNRQYKIVFFDWEAEFLKERATGDTREARKELYFYLAKEVEKEAEENGWTLENSTKE